MYVHFKGLRPYITPYNVEESGKVDPFTFGIVFTGVTGGSLVLISILDKSGVKINEGLLQLVMETAKYGSILYLLKKLSFLFM